METECTYDYLFVYDGESYQSPLLASLSGKTLPQPIEAKSGKVGKGHHGIKNEKYMKSHSSTFKHYHRVIFPPLRCCFTFSATPTTTSWALMPPTPSHCVLEPAVVTAAATLQH